jgi:hypothetical protein
MESIAIYDVNAWVLIAIWLICSALVNWVVIHWVARGVEIFHRTQTKAVLAAIVSTFATAIIVGLIWSLSPLQVLTLGGLLIGVMAGLAISILLIKFIYDSSWLQSSMVTASTLLGNMVALVLGAVIWVFIFGPMVSR